MPKPPKPKIWKECKKCGKEFEAPASNQLYCKNPCLGARRLTIAEANAAWGVRSSQPTEQRKKISRENFINGRLRIL